MLLLERLSRVLEEEGSGLGDLLLRLPLSRSSSPGLRDPCLRTLYVCTGYKITYRCMAVCFSKMANQSACTCMCQAGHIFKYTYMYVCKSGVKSYDAFLFDITNTHAHTLSRYTCTCSSRPYAGARSSDMPPPAIIREPAFITVQDL